MSDHGRRHLPGSRRLHAGLAALVILLLALAALGIHLYERQRTGSIYHPHARFVPQPTPTLPASGPARFAWPLYGYTKNHTRFFPAPAYVHPPFKQLWVRNGHSLLEFPPVIYGEDLFQLGDDAVLSAIDKRSGRLLWSRSLGQLSASSPAATANTVYVTILYSGHPNSPGRIIALNSANGAIRWWHALPSGSESSPLIDQGHVFFGSQNGTVYALNDSNGAPVWTYRAASAVKASPTLSGGVLYFGDYSGRLQAISEQTGRRLWVIKSEGALLGSGNFYSTAAVVYGRVFLGNTDGHIYAYDASSGRLDWAMQTGAYVYGSPAVTNAPGLGPTIYIGSYNGTFYAINARSGQVSWSFNAHGRISGSATILGRDVYFSDLGTHSTYGLGISTGRVLFEKATGAFDPVISDGTDVYLTGDTGLYGLRPQGAPVSVAASGAPRKQATRITRAKRPPASS
ncbi:MAG: PQQ-binding-like beta-propeller repeat protein [Solirubrobacteraceae bacterium]